MADFKEMFNWRQLDGLVGELMMKVPQVDNIEKTDLIELIYWMRKIILDEEELEGIDYEYFDNYYRSFFELNFPNGAAAYDAIFEEISAEDIIEIAYSNPTTDSVILL